MDSDPVRHHQRATYYISAVLMFAKDYLHIGSDTFVWDWELETLDQARGYAGIYDPVKRQMRFNGEPSLNTILHEAVHYKQHERGDDLVGSYASLVAMQLNAHWTEEFAAEVFQVYRNNPHEVEARDKAYEMAVIYRDRCAGLNVWG